MKFMRVLYRFLKWSSLETIQRKILRYLSYKIGHLMSYLDHNYELLRIGYDWNCQQLINYFIFYLFKHFKPLWGLHLRYVFYTLTFTLLKLLLHLVFVTLFFSLYISVFTCFFLLFFVMAYYIVSYIHIKY